MRKLLLIMGLFLLGWGGTLFAQQGRVASGGDASGSGGTVSFTIGQIDYISVSNTNGSVNQGIQQPLELFTVGTSDIPGVELSTSVYPNPTVESLTLQVDKDLLGNLEYQLYDVVGKLIMSSKVDNVTTSIDMSQLASSSYFLKVLNSTTLIKTYKIIKNK